MHSEKNKSYFDSLNEINSDELLIGLLGYGLFAERIVPIFTSVSFCDFYIKNESKLFEDKKPNKSIEYYNIRNINIPRVLSIPHPIAYAKLCDLLAENWKDDLLLKHFKSNTENQKHKISKIHIRKFKNKKSLFNIKDSYDEHEPDEVVDEINQDLSYSDKIFDMNYKAEGSDYLESELLIGKKFLVKADISNCFPSIYTHSIPWALMGKPESKGNRDSNLWENKIDKYTRQTKNDETNGILIGSHAYNLISEIILTKIDNSLYKKYKYYIRYIDDYYCYVRTYEEAENFLRQLDNELKEYCLSLNHKKTEISKLPLINENWKNTFDSFQFTEGEFYYDLNLNINEYLEHVKTIKTKGIVRLLNLAIELMHENNDNTGILNFAIKKIDGLKLSKNAIRYYKNNILHLVIIYPYLIHLLDDYIFNINGKVDKEFIKITIKEVIQILEKEDYKNRNLYEAWAYVLFFSIKYSINIQNIDNMFNLVSETEDCILLILGYLYDSKFNTNNCNKYKEYAKELIEKDQFDEYWLFIYEVLSESNFELYIKNYCEQIFSIEINITSNPENRNQLKTDKAKIQSKKII